MFCSQPHTHLLELAFVILVPCLCWSHLEAALARVHLLPCQSLASPCLATKQIFTLPVCHIHEPCPLPSCEHTRCNHQLNRHLDSLMFLLEWTVLWVLMQRGVYDWYALSLGLAASVRPASDTLTSGRPPQLLCTLKTYLLLVLTMCISFAMYWGCLAWLTTRPWFTGGNGISFEVRHCTTPSDATAWRRLAASSQLHRKLFWILSGEHDMILSDRL